MASIKISSARKPTAKPGGSIWRPPAPPKANTRTGSIVPVSPPGPRLLFHIDPQDAPRNGGAGGWDVIARPRRVSALEWGGLDPYEVTFPLIFGVDMTDSVEADCLHLQRLARPVAEGFDPPIVQLALHNYAQMRFVIQKVVWSDEYREKGLRVRATATVTFLEYHAADITTALGPPVGIGAPGPGSLPSSGSASLAPPAPARPRTYTVRPGDTIAKIATLMNVDASAIIAANTEPGHTLVLHTGDVLAIPPAKGGTRTGPRP